MTYIQHHLVMLQTSCWCHQAKTRRVHDNYSTPTTKDPPEGKTTVVKAVIRGTPKVGCHCHCSNKHYMPKLVRVLLDSGSDGNFVIVSKEKPMLLPYSKILIPQLWTTLNGIFLIKRNARIDLTSLNTLIAKSSIQNLRWLSTTRVISRSMTSFLEQKPWKSLVSCWTLKPRQ